MKRLLLDIILLVGAVILAFFVGSRHTADVMEAKHQGDLARINAMSYEAARISTEAMREQEQKHAQDMAALDAQHTKALNDEIASKDRSIADLRAGTVRVRDHFTCPGSATGAAGQAGTRTSVGDAAGAGGLQAAHVEFLLREAGRADEAVKQLEACQVIVAQDRGQ